MGIRPLAMGKIDQCFVAEGFIGLDTRTSISLSEQTLSNVVEVIIEERFDERDCLDMVKRL